MDFVQVFCMILVAITDATTQHLQYTIVGQKLVSNHYTGQILVKLSFMHLLAVGRWKAHYYLPPTNTQQSPTVTGLVHQHRQFGQCLPASGPARTRQQKTPQLSKVIRARQNRPPHHSLLPPEVRGAVNHAGIVEDSYAGSFDEKHCTRAGQING